MFLRNASILLLCLFSLNAFSESYLERFQKFMHWRAQLPSSEEADFIHFISESTPLAQKLRNRWLYQLAAQKDWKTFLKYYQPTNATDLQCAYAAARIAEGQGNLALSDAKKLWLTADNQPQSCDVLFHWLLTTQDPDHSLLTERVRIALIQRKSALAERLWHLYSPFPKSFLRLLHATVQNPSSISSLVPGPLHGDLYLFGLKQLVAHKKKIALSYWQSAKTSQLLNDKQKQDFLTFLVIYKAMRNDPDTENWFAQIQPEYYSERLLDWMIRYALHQHNWKNVENYIALSSEKDNPAWQYWLARSYENTGKTQEALVLFEKLSHTRQYYGFLASQKLHKKLHFMDESTPSNRAILALYQPILTHIQMLLKAHHQNEAAGIILDFASELPKEEKSAFAFWVNDTLQWHNLGIYLSNGEDLNNHLELRFPLAHQADVISNSSHFQIPPELVFAIIRQESNFRTDVISPAGAYGLMQILPETARRMALKKRIPLADKRQLFSAALNIKLGTAYLQQLSQQYHHHPILMAGAYNAGPNQVNYWLKTRPNQALDIWIETLPWHETRNYLKNITAFYAVYQYRMQKKEDLNWLTQTNLS